MKYSKRLHPAAGLALCALLLVACSWLLAGQCAPYVSAQSSFDQKGTRQYNQQGARDRDNPEKLSQELLEESQNGKADDEVKVVLQLNGKPSGRLNALLKRSGVHVKGNFDNLQAKAVELPSSALVELAALPEVSYVAPDRTTVVLGHVTQTTGTDDARSQYTGGGSLDGNGVGIAVLDSGVDASHLAFADSGGHSRVVYSQDFTGEGRTDDPFGHGTLVASIAAGGGDLYQGQYGGVAPAANVVNLRVLDSQGRGTTSSLLAALDWVLANHAAYNIRVVNLSLGAPAVDSYMDDPACRAVRRLVDVGIVVAAAAGNDGKDAAGNKLYGLIHSPGDEPSAITVGASNTFGTDSRSDDTVTTYSSRGPTRGYWTDTAGVRHYDNLVKPDLVAPGNRVVAAESQNNYLVTSHPELDAVAGALPAERFMRLSGTSMATPVAAGASALVLQANPTLTPNLVKLVLMFTAEHLPGYAVLEQGAGALNVEGAVRLAKAVRTDLGATTAPGSPLLASGVLPGPWTTIEGSTFPWSQSAVLGRAYSTGPNLATLYLKSYGAGYVLGDGIFITDGSMTSDGIFIGDGIFISDGIFAGDGIFIGDGIFAGDGILTDDGIFAGDGIFIGDGRLTGDDFAYPNS